MPDKPTLTLWTFKFVVRAANWGDAAKVLNETLDIKATHDTSDREISELYLISSLVNEDKLTKEFYESIEKSANIAIHSDEKSAALYPRILIEVRAVEEEMRWLLLHVSDAIDNFAEQFSKAKDSKKKSDIITTKSLAPITSTLTFEAMMKLLSLDQSWARDGVTVDQMRTLMDSSADFGDFKKLYTEKTAKKTTWDSISSLVLKKSVTWKSVEDWLHKIRGYRNKCAHFHTVTEDDLLQAQHARRELDKILTKKKIVSRSEIGSLRTLNDQLAQTLKIISRGYMSSINTSAFTALSSQIDTMKLSQSMQNIIQQSIPTDTIIRATQNMIPRLDIPTPSQSLIDSINRSISSMNGHYGPDEYDTDEPDSERKEK